jgi:hypothetical protein
MGVASASRRTTSHGLRWKSCETGHLVWETAAGDIDFTAEWLHGDERAKAWVAVGIHEDVAGYM